MYTFRMFTDQLFNSMNPRTMVNAVIIFTVVFWLAVAVIIAVLVIR